MSEHYDTTTPPMMEASRVQQRDEQLREEGRREILKDIAAIEPEIVIPSPDGGCTICRFCHAEAWVNGVINHESGCLWIRARTATEQRP